jgi:hypothetical protein
MAIVIQCKEKHFFDSERYDECPVCKKENQYLTGEQGADPSEKELEAYVRSYAKRKKVAGEPEDDDKTELLGSQVPHLKQPDEVTTSVQDNQMYCYIKGWLVCLDGPLHGQDFKIYKGFNKIGREQKNDISLAGDGQVAENEHCYLMYEEGPNTFHLVPGKGKEIFVNEKPLLEATALFQGDIVKVGGSSLEFIAYCCGDKRWSYK